MNELKNNIEDKKTLIAQVSVIIPFHGNKDDLVNCLKGLMNQKTDINFEILVVESANVFSIKDYINSFQNVKLISSQDLLYPGKARNIGVANSSSNLLAFIDADCVPPANWLEEVYSALKKGNEIVIGPIINLYPFHPIASVDNLLQFPDFQKRRRSNKIAHFPACNLGITKMLFLKAIGFPEDVIIGEDIMFSEVAINKNNGKVLFNPRLVVKHSGRKQIISFLEHNFSLGFYRGYLSLKISSDRNKFRGTFLYALLFGIKRLVYITVRTLQWNPTGVFRIIFYFPFLIIGLSAWMIGFWKGNKKLMKEQN